ncbi:aspartate aminotransferase, mitochondrial [Acrasis kona]|uniref:aspartate transaminase n=1 Tax=Acrasis kona TaxID=1008807 RepID=A0AAW2YS74_9EUKA
MFVRKAASFVPRTQLRTFAVTQNLQNSQPWKSIEPIGLDAIKQLTIAFQADTNPNKILLGEGVYRDDDGKPVVLKSIREAEKILYEKKLDHEYAPVTGVASFCKGSKKFAFDPKNQEQDDRIATVQTLSGTGSLRVAAAFLNKFLPKDTEVYFPDPTWGNHNSIFNDAGFNGRIKKYPYFDAKTGGLAADGFLAAIEKMPKGSVILLHACAHNPTGVDPTREVWKKVSKACKDRELVVFFDSAYQAFATGNEVDDAWAYRYFVEEDGHQVIVTQSYAKNFGLYGERTGALHVVTGSKQEATAVTSQLAVIIRAMYSSPPIFGARVVSTVLNDENLLKQWRVDVKEMADRIRKSREALVYELHQAGSKRDWSHITDQIGMFAFTGLTPEQVERLIKEQNIYMTKDGRMSISGLNTKNIKTVAQAIHKVTSE